MKPKFVLIAGALAAFGWLVVERRNPTALEPSPQAQRSPVSSETVQAAAESPADGSPQAPAEQSALTVAMDAAPSRPAASSPRAVAPTVATAPRTSPTQASSPSPNATAAGPKPPLVDPDARVALSFVGVDADAEAYWVEAINDPSIPPKERQDLIEDLNEDGFNDPKHPTRDELPLIYNRLAIIEELAADAMDQVNADAFQEAAKDLVNMAAQTSE